MGRWEGGGVGGGGWAAGGGLQLLTGLLEVPCVQEMLIISPDKPGGST